MLKEQIMNRSHHHAFTRWDLLICIATLGMVGVVGLLLPYRGGGRVRASRINCVSNLKQVGLAFRMWSNDHNERFPWQAPAAEGGTLEFAGLPYAALHFTVASNELNSPKILTCPSDGNRSRTNVFSAPLYFSLSYFAGIDASETNPAAILSGDRNLAAGGTTGPGLLTVVSPREIEWTAEIHKHGGNIGLADGSVSQTSNDALRKFVKAHIDTAQNAPIRFSLP
jgi:hypothetical protein